MTTAYIPELPTLDPLTFARSPSPPAGRPHPFDLLGGPCAHLFYLARAGVHHGVRQLLRQPDGGVLMPAYHHGVEVEAVRATGARVHFFRVGRDLRIDLEDLAARLKAHPDVELVYLTHYAGFPQPVAAVEELCRRHGVRLFEDCALSLLSRDARGRPVGSTGAASVFCLYKTLPLPHGGLLVANVPPRPVEPPPLPSTLHHAVGLVLAHLAVRGGRAGRLVRQTMRRAARTSIGRVHEHVRTGTMHLRPEELDLGLSRLVVHLIARLDLAEVEARRRRNFTRLAEALAGVVEVVGAPLPAGAVPLFVPIRVAGKAELTRRLRARGVEAVDFWSTGDPRCSAEDFPDAAQLRREILELPCHQSLDDAAIDQVALAARQEVRRG